MFTLSRAHLSSHAFICCILFLMMNSQCCPICAPMMFPWTKTSIYIPKCSMYGIFACIWVIYEVQYMLVNIPRMEHLGVDLPICSWSLPASCARHLEPLLCAEPWEQLGQGCHGTWSSSHSYGRWWVGTGCAYHIWSYALSKWDYE